MFLKCDDWRCTISLYIIAFRVIVERLLSLRNTVFREKGRISPTLFSM